MGWSFKLAAEIFRIVLMLNILGRIICWDRTNKPAYSGRG